jgi:hypothetical protein
LGRWSAAENVAGVYAKEQRKQQHDQARATADSDLPAATPTATHL